jgi:hypothetical protein
VLNDSYTAGPDICPKVCDTWQNLDGGCAVLDSALQVTPAGSRTVRTTCHLLKDWTSRGKRFINKRVAVDSAEQPCVTYQHVELRAMAGQASHQRNTITQSYNTTSHIGLTKMACLFVNSLGFNHAAPRLVTCAFPFIYALCLHTPSPTSLTKQHSNNRAKVTLKILHMPNPDDPFPKQRSTALVPEPLQHLYRTCTITAGPELGYRDIRQPHPTELAATLSVLEAVCMVIVTQMPMVGVSEYRNGRGIRPLSRARMG